MATSYQAIVTVHCDTDRDEVLKALENELGAGQYLFRAEQGHGDFSVTHEVLADDASIAQQQAEHLVSEALGRAGVQAGSRVVGAEIRSSS
jgi:hypothetical protein